MTSRAFPVLSGVLFAAGLMLGGMTQPSKVIAFLDFTGRWDPSLILVMVGAISAYAPLQWLIRQQQTCLVGNRHELPKRARVDTSLLLGAALFGIGWGMRGFCPGPALASLGTGSGDVWLFAAMMFVGMVVVDVGRGVSSRRVAKPGTEVDGLGSERAGTDQ